MTTNQTIDGVSRKSLEQALKLAAVFDDGGDGADAESARGVIWILRALLDAPIPFPGYPPVPEDRKLPAPQPQGDPVHECQKCYGLGSVPTRKAGEGETEYRNRRKLYAEQPAPVAVDETAEFSKWTHEVIAESRIGGVTLKVQRMQHLTPSEEKSAHDAWMARAALNAKSR